MTMYKITITKTEPNPHYEEESKKWESMGYGRVNGTMPQPENKVKVLDSTLTDEEFQAVKKACLEVM